MTPVWFGLVWPLAIVHLVQGSPSLPPGLAPGPSVFGTRKSMTPAWFGLVWPLALVYLVQGSETKQGTGHTSGKTYIQESFFLLGRMGCDLFARKSSLRGIRF